MDLLEDIIRARFRVLNTTTYRLHNLFNSSVVITIEPENIQALLATKFNDFELGKARRENFSDVLGNGIFTAERGPWEHYRHQLKPQFTRDQVSDLDSADKHLNVLFKVLPEANAQGWVENVDLMPYLYRFTLDVSTDFLFGHSVNSQSHVLHSQDSSNSQELNEEAKFAAAMNYAQEMIAYRFRLRSFWWLIRSKKLQQAIKTLQSFAERFVTKALEEDAKPSPAAEEKTEKKKYFLLSELVKETRDPIELRDQTLHVLLAGRDTTSAMLGWAILLLSRDPREYHSLRQTVLATFGSESNPAQEITFESLKACKPVIHVLYEALRLFPLVPMNSRVAVRDSILPVGGGPDGRQPIAIRKGEQAGFSAYVMHRRKDLFGEDSDEFRPARWEGRKLGWDFVPFSGGPRICLGQQYALNEGAFVLVRLLQKFDRVEAMDMTGKIKKGLAIVLSPGDGVKVRLHKATE